MPYAIFHMKYGIWTLNLSPANRCNLLRAVILRPLDHLLRHRAPDLQSRFNVAAEMNPGPQARRTGLLRLRREVSGVAWAEVAEHFPVRPVEHRVRGRVRWLIRVREERHDCGVEHIGARSPVP